MPAPAHKPNPSPNHESCQPDLLGPREHRPEGRRPRPFPTFPTRRARRPQGRRPALYQPGAAPQGWEQTGAEGWKPGIWLRQRTPEKACAESRQSLRKHFASGCKTLTGKVQNSLHLIQGHVKHFGNLLWGHPRFEILKDRLHRHARTPKNPGAAHPIFNIRPPFP